MNIGSEIQELNEIWEALFPNVASPERSQWALWLMRHEREIVREAIIELGRKYHKLGGAMDTLWMRKFASAVMNRLSCERATVV